MEKFTAPEMWDYLSDDMSNYLSDLPFYVNDALSDDQVFRVTKIIEDTLSQNSNAEYNLVNGGQEEYRGDRWYDPKKVVHMSREMLEYDVPEDIEKLMDSIVKPLYRGELRLAHWNYIDYDLRHGDGRYAPSLPPHIDNSEDLLTFNYMLDGNIDWDLYIDNEKYQLKKGQAIVFSALNQPHFRPKRKWKKGEFIKILTFDYSPPSDFRFTGKDYALDPGKFPERLKPYLDSVNKHPKMQAAWMLYNSLGEKEGISDPEIHGTWEETDEL